MLYFLSVGSGPRRLLLHSRAASLSRPHSENSAHQIDVSKVEIQ